MPVLQKIPRQVLQYFSSKKGGGGDDLGGFFFPGGRVTYRKQHTQLSGDSSDSTLLAK